ncbi:hypothetical protein TVAG_476490 [Trichomonas vaginalis G3]|uniref:receptor protein-tyrosine kinase n=1 Tax=Trichomonas vaginalis (strain ATCC PRA-98 / G3) TaxID=412133 RepID=A2DA72_TRIV3|nr:hypothetical protein TVAG_476490 [Trichomonas vaginalis G3]|eukprot:XP_001583706.1 hypothetical protein [Trichomonas vaginalis G3]
MSKVGASGTSFISDNESIVFSEIFNGNSSNKNYGNGKVTIRSEYICIDSCINCENNLTCLECDSNHVLYEGKCELKTCPVGYINIKNVCKPIIHGTLIYNETGYNTYSSELRPGLYDIECFGAQGGNYWINKRFFHPGGYGSYSHAKIKVTNENLRYKAIIGEQGNDNHDSTYRGHPDGGYSTLIGGGYKSGSGGGSSRVILNENIYIFAAGGSGASSDFGGAFGGGNNTCF